MARAYSGSMMLRRAVLRWQLFAVPVLPLWLLVGFGVFGGRGGFFLVFLGAGVLFAFLAAVAGLTRLRPLVRETRGLAWWDVAGTLAFHVAIVGLGFFGSTGIVFGAAAVLLGLATFWLTVWELTREWRERVSSAVARASAAPSRRRGPDDGEVIIVHEGGR
jgi:hypothetical protein